MRSLSTPIPIPKIILEGTSLTLKSDIALALAEHPKIVGRRSHRWHLPIVSSEWETISDQVPTKASPGKSLITFLPHQEQRALSGFEAWIKIFEIHRDYYWIVDRFHISTKVFQKGEYDRDYDFRWIENRLVNLGFFLVHLTRSADTYQDAKEQRLTFSENRHRYSNINKILRERSAYKKYISESVITHFDIDISDNDVDRAADEILEEIERRDGFWSRPWEE